MLLHKYALQRKYVLSIVFCLINIFYIYAESNDYLTDKTTFSESIATLLSSYLENDLELKKLTIQSEYALLNYDKTKISNGIALTLTTGNMVLKSTSSGIKLTLVPSASLNLPKQNNTTLNVSGNFYIQSETSISDDNTNIENFSLSIKTDLISGNKLTNQINNLKAERTYLEAVRAVRSQALNAEKTFYTELKSLFSDASTILSDEQKVYEEQINFDTVKAKGYLISSPSYRTADLTLKTAQRNLIEDKRMFVRDQNVFATKCGLNIETKSYDEEIFKKAWNFLPVKITETKVIDVLSFDKNTYTKIESAIWNKDVSSMERLADKKFTLSTEGGYTFNNTNTLSDTVDAGLIFGWKGITAKTGVSLPVRTNDFLPALTMGISFEPSNLLIGKINDSQKKLDANLESLELESAQENYLTDVVTLQTELGDILWSKELTEEEYRTYTQLAQETELWFKQGIVSESDLRSANVNKEKARINCLENELDLIIFNNKVMLLFVIEDK